MFHFTRTAVVLIFVLLVGSIAQAQERFTDYTVVVNDNFTSVEYAGNHIPSSGTIPNIQDYGTEVGETPHQCRDGGAGVGSHSVWFSLYFAGGTLIIDTAGSSYNTLMSVYPAAGSFAQLSAVACNDGITQENNKARISQQLPPGIYYVQVSRRNFPTPLEMTLHLSISAGFSGNAPANDNFVNALPIRFNETLTVDNIQYSTEEPNEPDRTCYPSAVRPTHSVWFKLTAPPSAIANQFSATTEGSVLDYGRYEDSDTVIETFYGGSLAALTPQSCGFDGVWDAAALMGESFPPDVNTMYIRITITSRINLVGPSSFKLKITAGLIGALDADWSFESNPLVNWTMSNANNGDGQICNQPGLFSDGVCSIQFVGGPDESSSLKQNIALPSQIVFKKNQAINLLFLALATDPATNLKGKVKIAYSDGTPASKVTVKVEGSVSPEWAAFNRTVSIASKHVSGMKVVFKNKSTAGTVYLDQVLILLTGSLARDAASTDVLPVPPAP